MARNYRIGATAGLLAAASMTFTPAQAAEMPSGTAVKHNTLYTEFQQPLPGDSASEASEYRRWGRWGRRGWRRGRRGVRAGDVLAGVAIIGGIAAIASAANNNRDRRDRDDRRRDRHRDWERENNQDREIRDLREQNLEQQRELEYLRSRGVDVETYRGRGAAERLPEEQPLRRQSEQRQDQQRRSAAPIGIGGAIDACSDAAGRDAGIGDISGVERAGDSWSVRGTIASGEPFTCRIGNDGQIEALDYRDGMRSQAFESRDRVQSRASSIPTSQGAYTARAQGQLSDNRYADARLALAQRDDPREPLAASYSGEANAQVPQVQAQAAPAYPGGPIPGEIIPETVDGDLAAPRQTLRN